jgi:hypothetical protein
MVPAAAAVQAFFVEGIHMLVCEWVACLNPASTPTAIPERVSFEQASYIKFPHLVHHLEVAWEVYILPKLYTCILFFGAPVQNSVRHVTASPNIPQ